ncbi:MAG: hypothetical protein LBM70_02035 [Victivallales bacterium]|jgi:predicted transcriptional regulator of viral defense system|nr:hypothetical protein [Victivallales bacterium]
MTIVELREKIPNDIFSALELNGYLGEYRQKRAKIASLLKRGEIVQIRRGLYTFAASLRREPLNVGVLANRIYGPSYVSEDFALSYYGMIPEATAMVTSVAMGRSRTFANEFGVFSYRYCRSGAYAVGVNLVGEGKQRFLVATQEKALFDKALNDKRFDGNDPESYLADDLRIDLTALSGLDKDVLTALAPFMLGRLKKLYLYLEAI